MSLSIAPISPSAAEISGLDCSQPLDRQIAEQIRRAFLDHPVLVFRDQPLSGRQFAAFAANFGELESFGDPPPLPPPDAPIERPDTPALTESRGKAANLYVYYHPEDSRVQFMTNRERRDMPLMGIQDNARMWHVDAQYRLCPNKITLLSNVLTPSRGGDTEYADMTLLYQSLSAEVQTLLAGCVALHQWSKSMNVMFAGLLDEEVKSEGDRIAALVPSMAHPLVRRHPDTGRPSLFISPRFTIAIDGLEPAQSEELLRSLFAAIDDPRFTYRHQWRDHDVVMWDNRRMVHRGHPYPTDDTRHMNSITLHGEQPLAM